MLFERRCYLEIPEEYCSVTVLWSEHASCPSVDSTSAFKTTSYCCSVAKSYLTLFEPMDCRMPGFPVLHYPPGVCSNSCPISKWCYPIILNLVIPFPTPTSIFRSIRVFSSELAACIRWPKYLASFSISPSNEYSGWTSFWRDWFDLFAVQGTLKKGLLQHYSSKASIFQCSAFFMFQLSHLYMTIGTNGEGNGTPLQYSCLENPMDGGACWAAFHEVAKHWTRLSNFTFTFTGTTTALTIQTFIIKVMSLLFNMLSSFVIVFLPRSNFMAAVTICSDCGAQESKSCHCFHFALFYLPWSDGTRCHDISFFLFFFFNVDFQTSFFILLFHLYQETL